MTMISSNETADIPTSGVKSSKKNRRIVLSPTKDYLHIPNITTINGAAPTRAHPEADSDLDTAPAAAVETPAWKAAAAALKPGGDRGAAQR